MGRAIFLTCLLLMTGTLNIAGAEESASLPAEPAAQLSLVDNCFVMICAALVILMSIPGIALFYGGLVRVKNMLSLLTQTAMAFSLMFVSLLGRDSSCPTCLFLIPAGARQLAGQGQPLPQAMRPQSSPHLRLYTRSRTILHIRGYYTRSQSPQARNPSRARRSHTRPSVQRRARAHSRR